VVIEKLDSLNGPAQNAERAISESLPLTTNSTNTYKYPGIKPWFLLIHLGFAIGNILYQGV
jgi:hypothetical protein